MRFQFLFDRCDSLPGVFLIVDIVHERSGNDRFGTGFCNADLGIGMVVSNFEENPLTRIPAAADEHPLALKLVAMQHEVKFTFLPTGLRGSRIDHIVSAGIPDNDLTCTVVALRYNSFEPAVVDRMIFGQHRETLLGWIETRPLGYSP